MIKKNILKVSELFSDNKYVLFYNIFDRIFFFLFFVLIARNYDVGMYGELVTVFTLCAIVSTIFDLGISYHLQREISRNIKDKKDLFRLAFRLNLLIFIPYILTAFIVYISFVDNLLPVFLIVIVINFIISQINICNKALSGLKNFKYQFIASFIPKFIFLIIYAILIYVMKAGIITLLSGLALFLLLNLAAVLYFSAKEGLTLKGSGHKLNYSSFLKLSLPLGIAIIINLLYDKIDILLVSKLTNFSEAGLYNAAYSIFKASALGFTFILNKGFTEFSEMSDDKDHFRKFILKYSKVITGICLIISIILFFMPEIFVTFFYSSKFSDSGIILKILSFALIGVGLNNLLGTALNGRGKYKGVMYITLAALIINIILNIIFIPIHGIKAAAVITVLTEWLIFAGELGFVVNLLNNKSKNAYI